MKEAKPVFKKENLLYEREEKEGYWTITSRVHPEARELIINPTPTNISAAANAPINRYCAISSVLLIIFLPLSIILFLSPSIAASKSLVLNRHYKIGFCTS